MISDETTPKFERPSTPLFIDLFAAQAILAAILWPVIGVIGALPRNADNSMRAIYTIPTFTLLAIISGLLIWMKVLPHRALRIVCWFLIGFAVLAIPTTLLDEIQRNGS